MQVYSLISGLKIYHPTSHFTRWSMDLLIRVPFQLHGEHTVLQPFLRIELIIHIAISVLTGTHFHLRQVKQLRVKCLAQGPRLKQCPKIERGETIYFSENPAPSGIRNRTAGSDMAKRNALAIAPCPSHSDSLVVVV